MYVLLIAMSNSEYISQKKDLFLGSISFGFWPRVGQIEAGTINFDKRKLFSDTHPKNIPLFPPFSCRPPITDLYFKV